MVERCALSGSDLKIKFRTILLTSITITAYISFGGKNCRRNVMLETLIG